MADAPEGYYDAGMPDPPSDEMDESGDGEEGEMHLSGPGSRHGRTVEGKWDQANIKTLGLRSTLAPPNERKRRAPRREGLSGFKRAGWAQQDSLPERVQRGDRGGRNRGRIRASAGRGAGRTSDFSSLPSLASTALPSMELSVQAVSSVPLQPGTAQRPRELFGGGAFAPASPAGGYPAGGDSGKRVAGKRARMSGDKVAVSASAALAAASGGFLEQPGSCGGYSYVDDEGFLPGGEGEDQLVRYPCLRVPSTHRLPPSAATNMSAPIWPICDSMNEARLSHLPFWGPSEGFFLDNSTAVGLTRMKRSSFGLRVRVNP